MKTYSKAAENHAKFKDRIRLIKQKIANIPIAQVNKGWEKACEFDFKLFVYRFCLHLFWGQPGELHEDFFEIANNIASATKLNGSRPIGFFENIIAPRGNAKSTLVSICFPVWQVLYKREKLILLETNNSSKAKENLKNISQLIRRKEIQQTYFPNISKDNTDELIVNGCKLLSKSINQDIRGLNEEGNRITLFIGDDIESEEMGNSPTQRERNYKTWTDAVEPAATTPTFPIQSVFLLVNTALHPECLVMKLKAESRYNTRIYPAVIKEPDNSELWHRFDEIVLNVQDEVEQEKRIQKAKEFYEANREAMDEGIHVNWSAGEPYWSLRVFRLQKGRPTFNREKQGNPINPEKLKFASYLIDGERIKSDLLFRIEGGKIIWGSREFELMSMSRFGFFDGAEGKHYAKGCYASLALIAHQVTSSEKKSEGNPLSVVTGLDFVIDSLLMRERDEIQAEKILLKCQQWKIQVLCIESSTFQGMYSTLLRMKAKELIEKGLLDKNYRLKIIPITPLAQKHGINKLACIDNYLTSLAFAPNTLKFNQSISQECLNQLIQFPTASHMDFPDSLAGALCFYYLYEKSAQHEKFQKQIVRI